MEDRDGAEREDLSEIGKLAVWSVTSAKPGNGVELLRDNNLDTYWQSDGAQPHLVNIQFQKKVRVREVAISRRLQTRRVVHPLQDIHPRR